jgi:hypothetical protein
LVNLSNSSILCNVQNPNYKKVEEDLEKYKTIIEQQQKIISILTNSLKNSNSQNGNILSKNENMNNDTP